MRQHLEDDLQRDCVTWFRLQYPARLIIAIPNGGKRNVREAARLKRMGVTAGVPDLFIPEPVYQNSGYKSGLWIELKIKPNTQTDSQKEIAKTLEANGYAVYVNYSIEGFMATVQLYFSGTL